jgi:hypothetical protein
MAEPGQLEKGRGNAAEIRPMTNLPRSSDGRPADTGTTREAWTTPCRNCRRHRASGTCRHRAGRTRRTANRLHWSSKGRRGCIGRRPDHVPDGRMCRLRPEGRIELRASGRAKAVCAVSILRWAATTGRQPEMFVTAPVFSTHTSPARARRSRPPRTGVSEVRQELAANRFTSVASVLYGRCTGEVGRLEPAGAFSC